MTSGWNYRIAYIECDACGEIVEGESNSITELWNIVKADDWEAKKVGSDWFHYCPRCVKEREEIKKRNLEKLMRGE